MRFSGERPVYYWIVFKKPHFLKKKAPPGA